MQWVVLLAESSFSWPALWFVFSLPHYRLVLCGNYTWNVTLPTLVPPVLTTRVVMMIEEWVEWTRLSPCGWHHWPCNSQLWGSTCNWIDWILSPLKWRHALDQQLGFILRVVLLTKAWFGARKQSPCVSFLGSQFLLSIYIFLLHPSGDLEISKEKNFWK